MQGGRKTKQKYLSAPGIPSSGPTSGHRDANLDPI